MNAPRGSRNQPVLRLIFAAALIVLFMLQAAGISKAANPLPANLTMATLTNLTLYINENEAYGSVDTAGVPLVLTLKRAGQQISQVSLTTTLDTFRIYFSQPMLAGDRVEASLSGGAPIVVDVPALTADINKASNIFAGSAPANSQLQLSIYSYLNQQWYYASPTTNAAGYFAEDMSSQFDILTSDRAYVDFYTPEYYRVRLRNYYVRGTQVDTANDNIHGYADPSAQVHLTVKNSQGSVKGSTITQATTSGSFSARLGDFSIVDIIPGDVVEVGYNGRPTEVINVVDVKVTTIDVAADKVYGSGPANTKIKVYVYDEYQGSYAHTLVQTNASGQFAADLSMPVPVSPAVMPLESGPTRPAERGTGVYQLSEPGAQDESASTRQPLAAPDRPNAQPVSSTQAEPETQDKPAFQRELDQAQRHGSPAGGSSPLAPKTDGDPDAQPAPGASEPAAATMASFNLLPGSYAEATALDANDSEVDGSGLYAGPYLRASINYVDVWTVSGVPNQYISTTLRNALGVIKAQGSTITDDTGAAYVDFYDSSGNYVGVSASDIVEAHFANGTTHSLSVAQIPHVFDRDNRRFYGSAPPNAALRLNYSGYWVADFNAGADGTFSYGITSNVWASYNYSLYYRTAQGDDVRYAGYTPVMEIYPQSGRVMGYGPANQPVVATVLNAQSAVKYTLNFFTQYNGRYDIYFAGPLAVGDTVIMYEGPLYFSQVIVPLTIAADPVTNVVYGTAPNSAWLNVFDESYFGPYDLYNYKYFNADSLGNFTASFSNVQRGDSLSVKYWQNGWQDHVIVEQFVPGVMIDQADNLIRGFAGWGANGTVTVRSSLGVLKDSAALAASDGYYSFNPQPALAVGDQVQIDFSDYKKTVPVIPFSGALDLAANSASGYTLNAITLGIEVRHWSGEYYSSWFEQANLSGFAATDASGNFSENFGGIIDFTPGDYLELYYINPDEVRYYSPYYTSQPILTVGSYPAEVLPGSSLNIPVILANGYHSQGLNLLWDNHPVSDLDYRFFASWVHGQPGTNLLRFTAPSSGMKVYFRIFGYIDGREIQSGEYMLTVSAASASTHLTDPVSGTTNDSTPRITGVTTPAASVTLYDGSTPLSTVTADDLGEFMVDLLTPLAAGLHNLTAVAKVSGVAGPVSNTLELMVDTTLKVDPVHIMIDAEGVNQHLRDEAGYANLGGQIWTRTSVPVNLTIPYNVPNLFYAELYQGGVYVAPLINNGRGALVGSFYPPLNGAFTLDVKLRLDGPIGELLTINILKGLIDPDGYIYPAAQGSEHRVAGAVVTCYEVSGPADNILTAWNGALWNNQENPQQVGADGYYQFFTLPGKYKIKVSAPGYYDYESPLLTVVDEPIHHNVALIAQPKVYLSLMAR